VAARNGDDVAVLHDGGTLVADVQRLGRQRGRLGVRAVARLAALLRGYTTLHVHLGAGVVWGVPAAWLAGRRVVAHWHGREQESAPRAWLRRALLRRADRVLAVSRALADELAQEGIAASVVYNGVELTRFAAPWTGGEGVLAIGRLAREKGFDVLAAAAAAVPGVPITLVGPPGSAPPPPGIRWCGEVSDVPERLARADVVVIPSRHEGASLVAMEAMAAGAPIIASQVGGLPEVLGNVARWVPPGDPGALADAIARVLTDDALRVGMSAAGRARAARFDLAATAAAWSSAG
jgi:glycosyltransferase involved in cell wall biosynthesis